MRRCKWMNLVRQMDQKKLESSKLPVGPVLGALSKGVHHLTSDQTKVAEAMTECRRRCWRQF